MARIRSVHPGLFTDEAFASCSPTARILLIGVWTECDDHGVFEWKPITLKMRVMPADNVDMEALLAELEGHNVIRKFTYQGRQYGAVRNFCRYQKPKKAKYVHVIPDELLLYVASTLQKEEPDDDEAPLVPQKGELDTLREEGGGKRKDEGSLRSPGAAREMDAIENELREAAGLENDPSPALFDLSPINALIAKGFSLSADILPKLREAKARNKRGRSWSYYVPAITEGKTATDAIPAKATAQQGPPVVWVADDDPQWAALAARHLAETGKRVTPAGSRHGNGLGRHFPADWLKQPERA